MLFAYYTAFSAVTQEAFRKTAEKRDVPPADLISIASGSVYRSAPLGQAGRISGTAPMHGPFCGGVLADTRFFRRLPCFTAGKIRPRTVLRDIRNRELLLGECAPDDTPSGPCAAVQQSGAKIRSMPSSSLFHGPRFRSHVFISLHLACVSRKSVFRSRSSPAP